jgi:hypothetical protein
VRNIEALHETLSQVKNIIISGTVDLIVINGIMMKLEFRKDYCAPVSRYRS